MPFRPMYPFALTQLQFYHQITVKVKDVGPVPEHEALQNGRKGRDADSGRDEDSMLSTEEVASRSSVRTVDENLFSGVVKMQNTTFIRKQKDFEFPE